MGALGLLRGETRDFLVFALSSSTSTVAAAAVVGTASEVASNCPLGEYRLPLRLATALVPLMLLVLAAPLSPVKAAPLAGAKVGGWEEGEREVPVVPLRGRAGKDALGAAWGGMVGTTLWVR